VKSTFYLHGRNTWVHKTNLTQIIFIEVPVSCQVSKRAYIYLLEILLLFLVLRFVARFWNCSEGVVFLAFQFLINKVEHHMQYALNKYIVYVFYLLQRVRIPPRRGELDTTLCDKVCQ
jgi:hypothetical protein